METQELSLAAHYKIRNYSGVAWYLNGYATTTTEESWELACEDPMHMYEDHYAGPHGEEPEHPECWLYSEPEEIEDREYVRAVMVGDDREEIFPVDDLILIKEDGFCRDCGQIGCTSNTYE